MTMAAEKIMMPSNVGLSLRNIELTASRPIPGQANTNSTSRAPERRFPTCRPAAVITGMMALRRACL